MPNSTHRAPHSVTLPVRWSDFDRYGHVNNAVYLDYSQEARYRVLVDGMDGAEVPMSVARNVSIDFLRPILPGTREIIIDTEITDCGRTSYTMVQTLRTSADDIVAKVTTVLVVIDGTTLRPVEVTPAAKAMLQNFATKELTRGDSGETAS
ncbi:acyl-CoA thioesterase [Corynebacterium sp. TAE3-ERU12]|uniref:acyl-CoA thioesterase n=1 Tax=Corynebacterium sp. TAE3-ERU12 TaxID=2849491 RepID=UPI001C439089|nr:acyl-CoA thioesterase [Corynebacterium sp. TAE3-ERU12]MBV7294946.1 acyl-CoA thioesterase [Corynebacterium sp. TAE3-ERU12]